MYQSKAKPLSESIKLMQNALKRCNIEYKFSSFYNPLKHSFWVNLSSLYSPTRLFSNGKGASKEAATASALGEFIERLQTKNFFNDIYLKDKKHSLDQKSFKFNDNYLNPKLKEFYNPSGELTKESLLDFNSNNFDKIIALPFKKLATNETIYFPVNILHNLYASNGLATGNTPKEAQVQAICEIIERYTKFTIIKQGYSLPTIPNSIIKEFKNITSDIKELQNLGYKIDILDASLGGKFPVVAISLIDKKNSTIFYSFGSHPKLEVAIERTLTELLQGRTSKEFKNLEIPTFDLDYVKSSFNLESHFIDSNGKVAMQMLSSKKSFKYTPFNYSGNSINDEHKYLVNLIYNLDKEIYIRDYNYLNFYSCQVLIPGLSEVYPVDDLVYNNSNQGKFIRDLVLNFKTKNPNDLLEKIEFLDENINLGEYIGVIFENSFNIRELKAQLLLLLGEIDDAMELLEYSDKKLHILLVELYKMNNQNLNFNDYKEPLIELFGEELLNKAIEILEGRSYLVDITFAQEYLDILEIYDIPLNSGY